MTREDPLQRFRLDGKVAVVTGASSGIGEGIARGFAAAGATVYAVARRLDRLEALAAEHPGLVPHVADLSEGSSSERLVADVVADAGRLDLLVNNAGVANIARAVDEDTAALRRVLELNLVATFVLAREAGRVMVGQGGGGAIVNIASVTGMRAMGAKLPQAAYAASKGGCINLTRELAAQWARHGVRVNAIAPGWIETEMTQEWLVTERGREMVAATTPLRRPGTTEEVTSAALYLGSDASSYVTGVVLPVDGGWTAH